MNRNLKTETCDSCKRKWLESDLFICKKCGYRWCMPCSFKGRMGQPIPLNEMSKCLNCNYVVRLDDHISKQELDEIRAKSEELKSQ